MKPNTCCEVCDIDNDKLKYLKSEFGITKGQICGRCTCHTPTPVKEEKKECRCYCHEVAKQAPQHEHVAHKFCSYYVPLPHPDEKPNSPTEEECRCTPFGKDIMDTNFCPIHRNNPVSYSKPTPPTQKEDWREEAWMYVVKAVENSEAYKKDFYEILSHAKPTPHTQEDWEKEFEMKFYSGDGSLTSNTVTHPYVIKSFIRTERQEEYERGRKDSHYYEQEKYLKGYDDGKNDARNDTLQEIIALIEKEDSDHIGDAGTVINDLLHRLQELKDI